MMWALFVQKKYFGKKINLFLWENGSKSLENSTKICPYPNIGKYSLLPLVSMIVSNLLKKSQKTVLMTFLGQDQCQWPSNW